MKQRFLGIATCLLLLCSLLAVGCGNEQITIANTHVVLNEVAHSIFYAPLYVAIEKDYFNDEGIDLELVTGFGA
jgi:NitT/TauT family transport system substrate-binding protein